MCQQTNRLAGTPRLNAKAFLPAVKLKRIEWEARVGSLASLLSFSPPINAISGAWLMRHGWRTERRDRKKAIYQIARFMIAEYNN